MLERGRGKIQKEERRKRKKGRRGANNADHEEDLVGDAREVTGIGDLADAERVDDGQWPGLGVRARA